MYFEGWKMKMNASLLKDITLVIITRYLDRTFHINPSLTHLCSTNPPSLIFIIVRRCRTPELVKSRFRTRFVSLVFKFKWEDTTGLVTVATM